MLQQPIASLQMQLLHQYPTSQQLNSPSQQFSHPPPPIRFPPPLPVNIQNISIQQMAGIAPPGCKVSMTADKEDIISELKNNSNTNIASLHGLPSNTDNRQTQDKCLYLKQLLQDKKQIQNVAGYFSHADRILDEEIVKVRSVLFQNGDKIPLELPPPQGPTITLTEKIFVPVKDHPEFNFVGRILGPRGLTAKQLEQETKCKIMVRGRGSTRDKNKEEANRGKPNWEHLNDELHILITVEDSRNRAQLKMQRAMDEIRRLLVPTEGDDELKKKQLMELAIINGTYKDSSSGQARFFVPPNLQGISPPSSVPPPPPLGVFGTPTISRLPSGQTVISNGPVLPPPLLPCGDGHLLYYTPVEHPQVTVSLPEYNVINPTVSIGKTPLYM